MRIGAGLAVAAAVFAGIFGATGAQAATINVPGNNGKSIQDGVDLADPGDTVKIKAKKKSYFENVVVTTNRIKLVGVAKKGKKPVIDGTSVDGNTHDLSLEIIADNVTVRNLGSRHGTGNECTGEGCLFERVAVSMSDHGSDCIQIEGNRGKVLKSNLIGCDSYGVEIDGNGGRVVGNAIRQTDSGCVDLDGDRMSVIGNTLHNCEDDEPIDLSGDDATIRNNVGSNSDYGYEIDGDGNLIRDNVGRNFENDDNFDVSGDRNRLIGNRAVHSGGEGCFEVDGIANRIEGNRAQFCDGGYEIDGENMKVINNRLADNSSGDDGFGIECFDLDGINPAEACERAVVSRNRAADAGDDDEGFNISDSGTDGGMVIRGNVSADNNDGGFEINVDDALIANNSSSRDGAEANEPGFEIDGDDNRIEANEVFSSGDDGLNVGGVDNKIVGNVVRRSNIDGIAIDSGSTDAVVRANRALGNFGDGIENDGTDTDVVKNRASGNRRDCVNDGTIATKQGNKCADGSNFNQAGTVDRPAHRRG